METSVDSVNAINDCIIEINQDLTKVKTNAGKKLDQSDNKTELLEIILKADKILKIMGNMGNIVSKLNSKK